MMERKRSRTELKKPTQRENKERAISLRNQTKKTTDFLEKGILPYKNLRPRYKSETGTKCNSNSANKENVNFHVVSKELGKKTRASAVLRANVMSDNTNEKRILRSQQALVQSPTVKSVIPLCASGNQSNLGERIIKKMKSEKPSCKELIATESKTNCVTRTVRTRCNLTSRSNTVLDFYSDKPVRNSKILMNATKRLELKTRPLVRSHSSYSNLESMKNPSQQNKDLYDFSLYMSDEEENPKQKQQNPKSQTCRLKKIPHATKRKCNSVIEEIENKSEIKGKKIRKSKAQINSSVSKKPNASMNEVKQPMLIEKDTSLCSVKKNPLPQKQSIVLAGIQPQDCIVKKPPPEKESILLASIQPEECIVGIPDIMKNAGKDSDNHCESSSLESFHDTQEDIALEFADKNKFVTSTPDKILPAINTKQQPQNKLRKISLCCSVNESPIKDLPLTQHEETNDSYYKLFSDFPETKHKEPPLDDDVIPLKKPKRDYSNSRVPRAKNKKAGSKIQKTQSEAKFEEWAFKINHHFDDIDNSDLVVE